MYLPITSPKPVVSRVSVCTGQGILGTRKSLHSPSSNLHPLDMSVGKGEKEGIILITQTRVVIDLFVTLTLFVVCSVRSDSEDVFLNTNKAVLGVMS